MITNITSNKIQHNYMFLTYRSPIIIRTNYVNKKNVQIPRQKKQKKKTYK